MKWNHSIQILNCYGRYLDRQSFWEVVEKENFLKDNNLVVVGDLNLTLSMREVWSSSERFDPLSSFFIDIFRNQNPMDVQLVVLGLTWTNKRIGYEGIAKRSDRFLCSGDFLNSLYKYISWILKHQISEHFPIVP